MKKQWKCDHCGFVWSGDSPPNYCPNCGHEKDDFKENEYQNITE